MLTLNAVGKRYPGTGWVLRGVDLTVRPGQVVTIAGGNGSGKSTLLRVVVGISRPTGGSVRRAAGVIGYVPERFPPGERLSALDYLTHLGCIRGLRRAQAKEAAHRWMDRLALAGDRTEPLRLLSKGNAQKIALAQALLVPPELLVLDEPWTGLDISARSVLDEVVGEAAASGAAVIFTDHRGAAAHVTDRYRLENGRLIAGTPTPPAIACNRVRLTAVAGQDIRDLLTAGLRGEPDGRDIILTVPADRTDDLLRRALDRGWSVREVGPEQGPKP